MSDMQKFMLDTSITSRLIRGQAAVVRQFLLVTRSGKSSVAISALTEAELLYGILVNPKSSGLRASMEEFLKRVDVLAWDSAAAKSYAMLRSNSVRYHTTLHHQDIMIAAQALSRDCMLVTSEQGFAALGEGLRVVDWTAAAVSGH